MKKLILTLSILTITISCSKEPSINVETITELSPSDPNNPNPFNGTMDPVSTVPYTDISNNTYIIELERWNIKNNRSNAEETTDNLQEAIDWATNEGYGIIKLPKGHYLIGKYGNDIYQAGIELHSNTAFLLDKDAIIEIAPNNKWNYCAIAVRNKTNVVISGGTILGDRDNHTYTPRASDGSQVHDEGHLICIEGNSKNITVQNTTLGKANGDGILLVGSPRNEPQELQNIHIKRNHFTDNRRQGVSIVGGKNILIEDNEIHHTNGTSPQFGVDLEGAGRLNEDITIKKNYFHNNSGGDIVNTDGKNVKIDNNILTQGEDSQYIDGPLVYWKNADMVVTNNNITMRTVSVNNWNGIIMYSNDNPKTNPATTFIENNILNNCGMYMYKGADLVIKNNLMDHGHLAFKEMTNLTLTNNKVTHENRCWAYRFLQVSGTASGNTLNDEDFDIPLSNTPWDGCWIN